MMKNLQKVCFVLILMISATKIFAQNNVGIGTTSPNSRSILELYATDKGF
jgi:hypothetical protein